MDPRQARTVMDRPLSPSALFSPSKAAQQRAQAQDWQHVDSWLAARLANSRSVPQFERNDETLAVLLELSAANERVDDEEKSIAAIEKEAGAAIQAAEEPTDTAELDAALLDLVSSNLTAAGQASLTSLSQLSQVLHTPGSHPSTLAHALISQTQHAHSQTQQLDHLSALLSVLQSAHARTTSELETLRTAPAFAPPPPSHARRAADYARQTKHLRAKLREYEDRLSSLPAPSGARRAAVTVRKVEEREAEVRKMRMRVEALEGELEAFGGLPGDRDGARKAVVLRQRELERLKEKRDRAFEGLVER